MAASLGIVPINRFVEPLFNRLWNDGIPVEYVTHELDCEWRHNHNFKVKLMGLVGQEPKYLRGSLDSFDINRHPERTIESFIETLESQYKKELTPGPF